MPASRFIVLISQVNQNTFLRELLPPQRQLLLGNLRSGSLNKYHPRTVATVYVHFSRFDVRAILSRFFLPAAYSSSAAVFRSLLCFAGGTWHIDTFCWFCLRLILRADAYFFDVGAFSH